MPKVSVVIPTYNRVNLLMGAVSSVLGQSFTDFEIVIVDDGSKDNTEERIKALGESRIKYFRNSVNKGVSAVRNIGITKSVGEYIAFLDDDDEWLPGKLEKQVRVLDESPNEVGAVYTGAVSVDITSGETLEIAVPGFSGRVLDDLIVSNFISTSSVLVRKECFEKVGMFDEALSYGEDFDLWIRIASVYSIESIQEILLKHKDHANTTTSNNKIISSNIERIIEKHKSLFMSNRKGLGNYLLKIGTAYCFDGNIKKGRQAILSAIKAYPQDARLYYNLFLTLPGAGFYKKMKILKANAARTAFQKKAGG